MEPLARHAEVLGHFLGAEQLRGVEGGPGAGEHVPSDRLDPDDRPLGQSHPGESIEDVPTAGFSRLPVDLDGVPVRDADPGGPAVLAHFDGAVVGSRKPGREGPDPPVAWDERRLARGRLRLHQHSPRW